MLPHSLRLTQFKQLARLPHASHGLDALRKLDHERQQFGVELIMLVKIAIDNSADEEKRLGFLYELDAIPKRNDTIMVNKKACVVKSIALNTDEDIQLVSVHEKSSIKTTSYFRAT